MPAADPFAIGVVAAIVALGAVVQGTVGFGLAMFAAPLVTLIEPRIVPGPMLCAALVLTLLIAVRERQAIDLKGIGWALAGRVPGVVLGAALLVIAPLRVLVALFGALVVLGALMIARGPALERTRGTLLLAGLLSGFMGTVASLGGPPIALVYQREQGPRIRGTLNGYFLVGTAMSLVALLFVGRLGKNELLWAAVLTPGVVLGFVCSAPAARWLDSTRRGLQRAVLGISATSGVLVIARQVLFV